MTPHFDWNRYFADVGNANIPAVDVQEPEVLLRG
jgi:hypothetical protein